MKGVAGASPADRPVLGQLANQLKTEIETALDAARAALESGRPVAGSVDVSLPGRQVPLGRRHPLTLVRNQVEAIFGRMGYEILEGPEIEDDYHNFEALNMPPEHPARDMQDTLYLGQPVPQSGLGAPGTRPSTRPSPPDRRATLLRTHTSAMQIRYMEAHEPPVRIVAIGSVFRRDNLDLTHTPMFHQFEGLLVDERVTFADLKGTLTAFVREVFAPDIKVIFRPSFFPYTEPSAEIVHRLRVLRRLGVPGVQAHRLARDPRQRHGAPGGPRGRGLRLGALHRLRVRHGHRARRDAEVRRGRHPAVLRERPAIPGAVLLLKLLASWLRELADVTPARRRPGVAALDARVRGGRRGAARR